jgi:hypothetical protein
MSASYCILHALEEDSFFFLLLLLLFADAEQCFLFAFLVANMLHPDSLQAGDRSTPAIMRVCDEVAAIDSIDSLDRFDRWIDRRTLASLPAIRSISTGSSPTIRSPNIVQTTDFDGILTAKEGMMHDAHS